ncbi:MAG: ATP-binding cassette domain-containing protein [Lachnospiraceae bacterium]|nr:ATP-binding cassette domain-containing protein [Lachnospiraceae bacterium]
MKVEVKNLSKKIRGTMILQDINLSMTSGHIYGLRGKNGSGKTMFMRCLCGLILPSEGGVSIDGAYIGKDIDFPPSVGVLIENPSFLNSYTGFQNLQLLAGIKGKISDEEIKEMLAAVGLEPEDKRKYKKYSLGMKQRLGIACALMESPDMILLDEPINALDQKGVELVKALLLELKKKDKLIVVACHDNGELEYLSDTIYAVENGCIGPEEKV